MRAYWQWLGVILAALIYARVFIHVMKDKLKQSVATWGLWGLLDGITFVSIWLLGGNSVIIGFYVLGSFLIFSALLYKKQFHWSWFETLILILVGVCLTVWYILGPHATTVAGTLSVVIATLPQVRDSWISPDRKSNVVWIGFFLVNTFYFMAGKSWEIKEVLYPAGCMLICAILVVANFRVKPDVNNPHSAV